MPTVSDILLAKGDHVYSISPDATVLDAVHKMNQHKLGALLVMDGEQVSGIFTERDVLTRVVGEELNPRSTRVADAMTREIICVPPHTDLDEVSAIMKQRRIRHLPVCGEADGKVHGMISIGDVNAHYASNQEATITFLNDYIFGRA